MRFDSFPGSTTEIKTILDFALADVLEIQSVGPNEKCLEVTQWLYQQGLGLILNFCRHTL